MNNFVNKMEILLYHSEDGEVLVNAYIKDETIWVTQKNMLEMFDVGIPAISKH